MKHTMSPIMIAVVCWFSFFALPAEAALITIEITAEVDYVEDNGNYLDGQINPGDIITGTYTYDSDTPDSSPLNPVQGNYWHYAPPGGVSFNVGGFNFATDSSNVVFRVFIRNDNQSGDDIYGIESQNNLPLYNGTLVDYIWWQLNDHTASALSSDALPTTAPILGQWQANHLRLETLRDYRIDAHVTSAIPEPATVLLVGLGGLILATRIKKQNIK